MSVNYNTSIPIGVYIYSIVRHLFTALGGFLVARGIVPDTAAVDQLIAPTAVIVFGAASYIVGQASSFIEKKDG